MAQEVYKIFNISVNDLEYIDHIAKSDINKVMFLEIGYPHGDGAILGGGGQGSGTRWNSIEYFGISSLGNSADFGDLTTDRWATAACCNGGIDRGVFSGGYTQLASMDYVTISSTGNASNFGNSTFGRRQLSGTENRTNDRGVFAGGFYGSWATNVIDYITISSTGNGSNFGDLTSDGGSGRYGQGACSNAENNRAIFGGGRPTINDIEYITITSLGNSSNFGDLTQARHSLTGCYSNGTNNRGVWGGGSNTLVMDYVTISTTGNATSFGNLTQKGDNIGATSNTTSQRLVFTGRYYEVPGTHYTNRMDYITINSTGNATDFGDLLAGRNMHDATSNA